MLLHSTQICVKYGETQMVG